MFKAVTKVLVLTMMFVAFIGQAMAFNTSMYCGSAEDTVNSQLVTSEQLNASGSTSIDSDNAEDCCDIECCDLNCSCVGNTCSSVTYFNSHADTKKHFAYNDTAYLQQFEQPNSISSSLYRPPIFTL